MYAPAIAARGADAIIKASKGAPHPARLPPVPASDPAAIAASPRVSTAAQPGPPRPPQQPSAGAASAAAVAPVSASELATLLAPRPRQVAAAAPAAVHQPLLQPTQRSTLPQHAATQSQDAVPASAPLPAWLPASVQRAAAPQQPQPIVPPMVMSSALRQYGSARPPISLPPAQHTQAQQLDWGAPAAAAQHAGFQQCDASGGRPWPGAKRKAGDMAELAADSPGAQRAAQQPGHSLQLLRSPGFQY